MENCPKHHLLNVFVVFIMPPTFKFPVKATLPFGFTLKQVVASEALTTYGLSESIPVCHVSVIPSREN